MLSLTAPLLKWGISDDLEASSTEKRRLAQRPVFRGGDDSFSGYINQFEDYFNDQFGFREKLVFFHNLIKYKLFGVSATNWVIPGKEGWLYFNERGDYKDYLPAYLYDEIHLELITQVLETRRDWLASLGSRYLVVPVPNKADIYGEYLPSRVQKYVSRSRYDQIIETLCCQWTF